MLDSMGQLFGPVRGGLGYSVIIRRLHARRNHRRGGGVGHRHGADLAADHAALRLQPALLTGVIAASGTLTQLMPPSLVLIVMADQLGKSVGDMYWAPLSPASCCSGTLFLLHFPPSRMLYPRQRRLPTGCPLPGAQTADAA